MGPINVNMRFQTLCITLSFLSCFTTQSYVQSTCKQRLLSTQIYHSLSYSMVGAMYV